MYNKYNIQAVNFAKLAVDFIIPKLCKNWLCWWVDKDIYNYITNVVYPLQPEVFD